jgi:hypothetical protein
MKLFRLVLNNFSSGTFYHISSSIVSRIFADSVVSVIVGNGFIRTVDNSAPRDFTRPSTFAVAILAKAFPVLPLQC